jgi:RNA polymerase sigma-70 factor (ECF subfamily)
MQTVLLSSTHRREAGLDFQDVVDRYYHSLYRFALSLTRSEADACDLTQQTFYTWGVKGGQLQDLSKAGGWLFTTLHRAFLQRRRKETRFPHFEISQMDSELPQTSPEHESRLDSAEALEALNKIEEAFRAPVALFYLEDCPYQEIARILGVPLGTVKSRIARGIAHLRRLLMCARSNTERIAA